MPNHRDPGSRSPTRGPGLFGRAGEHVQRAFSVSGRGLRLGRDRSRCDVVLSSPEVSSLHARVWADRGSLWAEDLGSTNGTWYSEAGQGPDLWHRMGKARMLPFGSRLRLGLGAATYEVRDDVPRHDPPPAPAVPGARRSSAGRGMPAALAGVLAGVAVLALGGTVYLIASGSRPGTTRPGGGGESHEVDIPLRPPGGFRHPLEEPRVNPPAAPKTPFDVVSISLANRRGAEGALVEPVGEEEIQAQLQSHFRNSTLRRLGGTLRLRNNYYGMRDYSGHIEIRYVQPDGQTLRNSASPSSATVSADLVLPRAGREVQMPFGWGQDEFSAFDPGNWVMEFWSEGRKIAEKNFTVYDSPKRGGL